MTSLRMLGGWDLHWEVQGRASSPPLLLLPPLGRSRASWQAQVPALSERFLLLLPDTRGTGQSSFSGDDYSLDRFAADFLTLMDHLDVDKAHVAGWSMGAAVAQELALLAPDRVRSLTLLTPWVRTDEPMAQHFRQMLSAVEEDDSLVEAETLTLELILSTTALAGIGDLGAAAQDAVNQTGFPTPQALAGHIRSCLSHDTESRLASLSIPTLVVGGEEDRLIPPSHATSTARALSGADVVILQGPSSSHALPVEMAAQVNDLMGSFLERQ